MQCLLPRIAGVGDLILWRTEQHPHEQKQTEDGDFTECRDYED